MPFEEILDCVANKNQLRADAVKKVGSLSPYLYSYLKFSNEGAITELENARVKAKVRLQFLI